MILTGLACFSPSGRLLSKTEHVHGHIGEKISLFIRHFAADDGDRPAAADQDAFRIDRSFRYIPVTELDPKIAAKVLPLGAKLGTAMKKSLGCAGFNLVQNNGEAAGQTVFHFHVHVIPRYEGGPVIAGWEPGKEDPEVLAETAEKIKDAL